MKSFSRKEIDLSEEISANKLFITLFYLTFVSYDIFRFFIDPIFILGLSHYFLDSLVYNYCYQCDLLCRCNAYYLTHLSSKRNQSIRY